MNSPKGGWVADEVKFNPLARACQKYHREKILNEKQEKFLNQVADETLAEIGNIDKKVRPLIEDFRDKTRNGMIIRSQELPVPSPEIEEFQKQKIALTKQAIEKLKKNFGEKDFTKFNNFVDENVRSGMATFTIQPPFPMTQAAAQSGREKGIELYKSGKYDEAVEILKKTSIEAFRDVLGFHYLGLSQEKQNDFSAAIVSHKKAVSLCIELIEIIMSSKLSGGSVANGKINFRDDIKLQLNMYMETAFVSAERLKELDPAFTTSKNLETQLLTLRYFSEKTDLANEKEPYASTPLKILSIPEPNSPFQTGMNSISTSVDLYVLFLSNGKIGLVIPKNGFTFGLTESAVRAAREITFEPATQNNKPISVIKAIQYTFNR